MIDQKVQSGYAPVNGLNLYYEIHGSKAGQPLVLVHGGLGDITLFSALIPTLAKSYQVIAVDLQAHGHTADTERAMTYEAMADDIAGLIQHLGFERVDLLGFSLGGCVALQTVMRHPEVVRKLVIISAPYKHQGWYPEVLAGFEAMSAAGAADNMVATIMYERYASVAPKPEDWSKLVSKTAGLLTQDYDWTEGVAAIKTPTLMMVGDGDSVRLDHVVEMYGLFGGGKGDGMASGVPNAQLAVLPGAIHWNLLTHSEVILPILAPFLDAPGN